MGRESITRVRLAFPSSLICSSIIASLARGELFKINECLAMYNFLGTAAEDLPFSRFFLFLFSFLFLVVRHVVLSFPRWWSRVEDRYVRLELNLAELPESGCTFKCMISRVKQQLREGEVRSA